MQPLSTAVATMVACVMAASVALTAHQTESQSTGTGEPRAARAASLTPFLANAPTCRTAVCPATAGGRPLDTPLAQVVPGERYDDPHLVTEPGRYALPDPPRGETYAVIGNTLVRIDADTNAVLSILRDVEPPPQ